MQAVAQVHSAGLPLCFEALFAGETRRRIALLGYPFQRERYWIDAAKRHRPVSGHPLLGLRHASASGEITFETEVFPTDPVWLSDHRVYGRVIVPGAMYGAMAALACLNEESGSVVVSDVQLHNALIFAEDHSDDDAIESGR
ncbi:MAG: polyketide synthase dehydratase domain-containing protein [Bacteroidota bacterium]|nr:polyketide synthase dehydratase domain-containing protein [Bacteroidota bacterium]